MTKIMNKYVFTKGNLIFPIMIGTIFANKIHAEHGGILSFIGIMIGVLLAILLLYVISGPLRTIWIRMSLISALIGTISNSIVVIANDGKMPVPNWVPLTSQTVITHVHYGHLYFLGDAFTVISNGYVLVCSIGDILICIAVGTIWWIHGRDLLKHKKISQ